MTSWLHVLLAILAMVGTALRASVQRAWKLVSDGEPAVAESVVGPWCASADVAMTTFDGAPCTGPPAGADSALASWFDRALSAAGWGTSVPSAAVAVSTTSMLCPSHVVADVENRQAQSGRPSCL